MTTDLATLRAKYRRLGIDPASLPEDPLVQFKRWHEEWAATNPYDAAAAVLATTDTAHRAAARYVDVVRVDHGFVFLTDHGSRKGLELATNPWASLCFGWLEVARQVRVSGTVSRLTDVESDAFFASQPRLMQLFVWSSLQSQVIASRDEVARRIAEQEGKFSGQEVPRPAHWGGYRLVPEEVEFWQGRTDNIQDRFRYRRTTPGGPWTAERLAP